MRLLVLVLSFLHCVSSSENDDQSEELYPLDNKYLNEADREMCVHLVHQPLFVTDIHPGC